MDFICKAQYTGIGQFVRCLEYKAPMCPFAVPLGSTFFCNSPYWANVYTKKNTTADKILAKQDETDETRLIS